MDEKIGRNDPCPCGSGLKYKKCCFGKPPKPKFKAKIIKSGPDYTLPPLLKQIQEDQKNASTEFKMTEHDFRKSK